MPCSEIMLALMYVCYSNNIIRIQLGIVAQFQYPAPSIQFQYPVSIVVFTSYESRPFLIASCVFVFDFARPTGLPGYRDRMRIKTQNALPVTPMSPFSGIFWCCGCGCGWYCDDAWYWYCWKGGWGVPGWLPGGRYAAGGAMKQSIYVSVECVNDWREGWTGRTVEQSNSWMVRTVGSSKGRGNGGI